jgi:hypothetical protein
MDYLIYEPWYEERTSATSIRLNDELIIGCKYGHKSIVMSVISNMDEYNNKYDETCELNWNSASK